MLSIVYVKGLADDVIRPVCVCVAMAVAVADKGSGARHICLIGFWVYPACVPRHLVWLITMRYDTNLLSWLQV